MLSEYATERAQALHAEEQKRKYVSKSKKPITGTADKQDKQPKSIISKRANKDRSKLYAESDSEE